jgi:hypothetical protein
MVQVGEGGQSSTVFLQNTFDRWIIKDISYKNDGELLNTNILFHQNLSTHIDTFNKDL